MPHHGSGMTPGSEDRESYDGDLMGDYDPGPISDFEHTAEGRRMEKKGSH